METDKSKLAEKELDEIINLFNGKPTNISFDGLSNLKYDEYFIMFINEKFGTNISPFTTKHSKITQFYYELFIRYGKDFYNNNPELFSYKLCEILKFHSSEINEFAKKLDIDYYSIRDFAEKHKIKEGMSKENFILFCHSEQFCDRPKLTAKQIKKYYELLNSVNLETRIRIVEEIKPNYMTVAVFSRNHINPNTKEICDKLKSYIADAYKVINANERIKRQEELKNRLEQKRMEQKTKLLSTAKDIVNKFIESDTKTIKEFCDLLNVDEKTFTKYVEIIKEYDPNLFNRYMEKTTEISNRSYAIIMSKAKSIIDKIKNGVELEDGTKRNFTIIDYYLTTKLNLDELFNLIKKDLSAADVRAFRNFASKNKNLQLWGEKRVENYYDMDITVGNKFDENNKIIPNSGHVLSLKEKKYIVKYIKSLNVPLCGQTVNIIQNAIVNRNIIVPAEKESAKKI